MNIKLLLVCVGAVAAIPALYNAYDKRDLQRFAWVVIALLWMLNYGMEVA